MSDRSGAGGSSDTDHDGLCEPDGRQAREKSFQTSADAEIQTVKVGEQFNDKDKFAIAAIFDTIGCKNTPADESTVP